MIMNFSYISKVVDGKLKDTESQLNSPVYLVLGFVVWGVLLLALISSIMFLVSRVEKARQ